MCHPSTISPGCHLQHHGGEDEKADGHRQRVLRAAGPGVAGCHQLALGAGPWSRSQASPPRTHAQPREQTREQRFPVQPAQPSWQRSPGRQRRG